MAQPNLTGHASSARNRIIALIFLAVLVLTSPASARQSVSQLAHRLRSASDFRVRVQAALALGATRSPAAAPPLCLALKDKNRTVRGAAATALGRLRQPKGLTCLRRRSRIERNAAVKRQIARAIKRILANSSSAASLSRAPNAQTRWYVTVGKVKFKGDSTDSTSVDRLVQAAVRKRLAGNPRCAIAPPGEKASRVRKLISGKRISGYFLQPVVDAPKYRGGKLTIRVRLTMYSFPNKALKGEVTRKLSQSGTPSKDQASERELTKMAADHVAKTFLKVAESSAH